MRTGGPLLEPIPLPLAEGTGGGRARISTFRRPIPVYPGLSRFIPAYPGLSRFIPVHSGLSWSVPVYSGPSRPVPVAGGRKRMRSAERRVKGAARTAAPCRERRRVRGSPTPSGPRAVDGVHAPVDSIRSPPGQPRSSRAPGQSHLEISGRLADIAIAGQARARPPSSLLPPSGGGREGGPTPGSAGIPPASREARTRMRAFGPPSRRDAGAPRQFTDERDRESPRPGRRAPGATPLPTSPLPGGGVKTAAARAPPPDDNDVDEPPQNFQTRSPCPGRRGDRSREAVGERPRRTPSA